MTKLALAVLASAVVTAAGLSACSSTTTVDDGSSSGSDGDGGRGDGSSFDSTPSPEAGLGELLFRPDTLYTGFDGTHTFIAPIAVYDSDSDLTVTASDSAAVTIAPAKLSNPTSSDGTVDNGKYYFLTAKKAGTVTLTASSKGRTTTATLTITAYDAARYAAGQTRYNAAGTGQDQPCTNCHAGGNAIDHSPATMAGADDQSVGIIITTGIKPPAIPITGVPGGHKWNVTPDQKDGLITYLRALEPKGFE